jgi:hypothetical protein
MAKQCSVDGCGNPSFGKDKKTGEPYCKFHQYKRTDKKPYKYKRKPTGERKVFDSIWGKRPHRSFLSGADINWVEGTDFYVNVFAHVLAKGKYPKFRLLEENILLLTVEEHRLLDTGTEEERQAYAEKYNCDWNAVYEYREVLIAEYKSLYLET